MNTILGTPFYISPDVLIGNYDCKCDMWSIGVMTYLMLSGQAPFYGTNRKQIFNSILTKEVDFSLLKNSCSDEALSFIQRCLEKNPLRRISSQEALNHKWFYSISKEIHTTDKKHINFLKNIRNFIIPNQRKRLFLHYFLNNLNNKELKSVKKTFIALDQSNKGYLTLDDFKNAFEKVESNISSKEIIKLFAKADYESCGKINFSQFIIAVTDSKVLSNCSRIVTAFKHFDFDNSELIEVDDLQKVVISSGHILNNLSYLDDVMSQDRNQSKIDIHEFKILFG
jgi:calcium-dependent protein kinase